ncbi:MAG TPA: SUF system NifU family Fe-S cluster assembly protein [Gemmatimonadaceae bacterium]|nr:SUF system NifU family Fe-S cluster assembly protein [Gemmatimonadaceae bacterium]
MTLPDRPDDVRRRSPAQLSALYQELILDHYRRPRNKGVVEKGTGASVAAGAARNPLCGDEVAVTLALDGDTVTDARFTGRGCSISQAAASMMTVLVRGRSLEEIAALRALIGSLLAGDEAAAADPSLGDARALAGVAKYPARHRCAAMAWEALGEAVVGRV